MNSGWNLYVTANVVPTICSQLRNKTIQFAQGKSWNCAICLQLTLQLINSDFEVGILIGILIGDHYWALTTGKKTKAPTAEYSAESPAEYSASRIFSRTFKMKADFAPKRLQLKIPNCGHNRK